MAVYISDGYNHCISIHDMARKERISALYQFSKNDAPPFPYPFVGTVIPSFFITN